MAIIELQDPLSTEIQSTTVSGAVDALNVISKSLDLNSELLEKVSMHPASGLDSSDPRRIYEVDNGNRLWLSSPNPPKIYVNDSEISSSSKQFSIDYVGGSITFTGSYRPSASDSVTVSCAHISAEPKVYGGSEIKITFTPGFLGQEFTVTGGDNETYSGVVDSSLESVVRVKSVNTTYTVSANSIGGKNFTAEVEIGAYYGQYEVSLSSFNATIEITTEPTATVAVNGPTATYNVTANEFGKATVVVVEEGNYSVTSTYKNANSNTTTVNVVSDGETYTTTSTFITLTVTVDAGSAVTVKNGDTTLTETASNGTAKFWLPNTGTWNITATLEDQETTNSIVCSAYQGYSIELSYVPDTLEECTWEQISKLSSSGKISSYFEVGDTKGITINGTILSDSYSNVHVDAFIIGINHNASYEGSNLTHFEIGKMSGNPVAFSRSNPNYPNSGYSNSFNINSDGTNINGWSQSDMRRTILSQNPSSPRSNSFMSALPSDLRGVMKTCAKRQLQPTKSLDYSTIGVTNDYLSICSIFEITGSSYETRNPESNYQSEYSYYKSGNSRYKYLFMGGYHLSYTAALLWTRTVYGGNETNCIYINGESRSTDVYSADYSLSVSPIFFV